MELSASTIVQWVQQLSFPFFRILAVFMSAPFFSHRAIPVRIKIACAAIIAFLVAPQVTIPAQLSFTTLSGILIIIEQIILGAVFGFCFQLLFEMFTLAGQFISMQAGLGFSSMMDPGNGISVPMISEMYLMLVTLIFLALNGHLALLGVVVQSFQVFPIGAHFEFSAFKNIVIHSDFIFSGALLLSLPVVISLLLVNVALGVMNRASPQLNIISLGFPVLAMLAIFLLTFLLDHINPFFKTYSKTSFDLIGLFSHAIGRG